MNKNNIKNKRGAVIGTICVVILAILAAVLWALDSYNTQHKINEQTAANEEAIANINEKVEDGLADVQIDLLKNQRELLNVIDDARDSIEQAESSNTTYHYRTSWKVVDNKAAIDNVFTRVNQVETHIYGQYKDLLKNIQSTDQGVKANSDKLTKLSTKLSKSTNTLLGAISDFRTETQGSFARVDAQLDEIQVKLQEIDDHIGQAVVDINENTNQKVDAAVSELKTDINTAEQNINNNVDAQTNTILGRLDGIDTLLGYIQDYVDMLEDGQLTILQNQGTILNDIANVLNEVEDANDGIAKANDALDDLSDDVRLGFSGVSTGITNLGTQVTGVGSQVAGVGSQVSGIGTQVSGIGSQVSGVGSQVTTVGGQVTGVGTQVTNLGTQIGGQLTGVGDSVTTLSGTVSTLSSNVTLLQGNYSALQASYTTLQSDYSALLSSYQALQGNYSSMQSTLASLCAATVGCTP